MPPRRALLRIAAPGSPRAEAERMRPRGRALLYWTGIAADLYRAGDRSCQWILEEAARGKTALGILGEEPRW
jgi:hypothetical protein